MAENQPANKSGSSVGGKILTVIGIVLCAVFGLLLLFNITIIVKGLIQPDVPPSVFGITPMVVKSGSMSSDVQHIVAAEDILDLTQEQINALKPGDTVKTASADYIETNIVDSVIKSDEGEVRQLLTTRPADDHIEVDDLILMKKVDAKTLKVGDIISFIDKQSTVTTHRIIAVTTDENGALAFHTKGDANNSDDKSVEGFIKPEKIVGLYQTRIPKLGAFIYFLQKPLGIVIFIGVPVLLFIAYDVIRRTKLAKKNKSKSEELEEELKRLRALNAEKEAETQKGQSDIKPEDINGDGPGAGSAE